MIELYHKNNVVREEDVLHLLEDERLNKTLMDVVTTREFQNIANQNERLEAYIHFFKRRNSKKERYQAKVKTLQTIRVSNSEEDIVVLLNELHKKNKNIHVLKNNA